MISRFQMFSCFLLTVLLLGETNGLAQDHEHQHLQTVADADLRKVVSLAGTDDGKFIYAAGFDPGFITCFSRDVETGMLTKAHSYAENGLLAIDLSDDEKYVVASSFKSNSVILYSRDADSGALTSLSTIDNSTVEGLLFPVDLEISPDSRFIYVSCSSSSKLLVLAIKDDKLEWLHEHEGIEECLKGSRIIAAGPKGTSLYIASNTAGTISIFDRDEDEGHVRMLDYIMDDSIYAALLAGVHGATVSPDGKNLYVTSGRFDGDNAVTVFQIKEDFRIKMVQELENEVELEGFTGGNHVAVSPDGKYVYASGAKSENVACFQRNLENGKLEFVNYLAKDGSTELGITAGIHISKDSKFVYVAGEGNAAIYVFQRSEK